MKYHLVCIFTFLFNPITADAQFVSEDNGSPAGASDTSDLEGFWGGYATCDNAREGYVVFLELKASPSGYFVEYQSLARAQKWRRQYEAIAVAGNKLIVTPLGEGAISDAEIVNGRMTWATRQYNCEHSYVRIDALPDGLTMN